MSTPGVTLPEVEPTGMLSELPFEVGQLLAGTYRLDGVLGTGGMGVVYAAYDVRLERHVAVKVARVPVFAEALANEGRALATLDHPGFARVHQLGRDRGVDYLAMERISGESLAARIDHARELHEKLALHDSLGILSGIADALSAAHQLGIAHRDVKAANVMLVGERVVLLDLGLAKAMALDDASATLAGSVYGMAPEVILGTVRKGEGYLVDLYAFGALAFELLVGVPPYTGDTVQSVLAGHVGGDVPLLDEEIPAELAALVRELLAKEPHDRPSCMEAVLWQIRAMLERHRRTRTVLVVDDDPGLLSAIEQSIRQSFPQLLVRASTDPRDALPRDGRAPADILVVDVAMPDLNGIEICMALRDLPAQARPAIIVMSGTADERDRDLLRTLGVDSFVPKDNELLAAIGNALARARFGGPVSMRPGPA